MKIGAFIGGVVLGAAASAVATLYFSDHLFHHHLRPPAESQKMMLSHYSEELELSPEQEDQVLPILKHFHFKTIEIRIAQHEVMNAARSEMERALMPILKPAQQAHLAEMKQRIESVQAEEERYVKDGKE